MMHIEQYCSWRRISRRHLKRLIDANKLPSAKINGQRFIITPPSVTDAQSIQADKFKDEIRSYVAKAGKPYIKEALKRIQEFEKATGTTIRGLSNKVLYKIAAGQMPVHHKKRSDSGSVKNSNLLLCKEKVEAIAAKLYLDCGEPNKRFVTTRIRELGQQHEFLYEIAAVPFTTLYNYVTNFFKANNYDSCWLFYNRHKDFLIISSSRLRHTSRHIRAT